MDGLILLVLGMFLIVAEAFAPSFGILGLGGLITFLVGSHYIVEAGGIFGIALGWGFFLGVAVVIALPMVISTIIIGRHFKKKMVTGAEGMIGEEAKIIEWDGKTGRVHVQGELWAAHSEHTHSFSEGDKVIISEVKDMSLKIHLK